MPIDSRGMVSRSFDLVRPEPPQRSITCAGATRSNEYLAYIDSRLSEPDLRPAHVASYFGVSERYMRTVLHAGGDSFSGYLMRRRLMRCADRLLDREWDGRTITDIAFDAGFNNVTYFGEAFKSRYGVTPRAYRCGGRIRTDALGQVLRA